MPRERSADPLSKPHHGLTSVVTAYPPCKRERGATDRALNPRPRSPKSAVRGFRPPNPSTSYRFEPYRAYQLTGRPTSFSAPTARATLEALAHVTRTTARCWPIGRPCEWHSRGHGFDPHQLHQPSQRLMATTNPLNRGAVLTRAQKRQARKRRVSARREEARPHPRPRCPAPRGEGRSQTPQQCQRRSAEKTVPSWGFGSLRPLDPRSRTRGPCYASRHASLDSCSHRR